MGYRHSLFLINILNFYDRNVAGAVVEPMRKEFHPLPISANRPLDDSHDGALRDHRSAAGARRRRMVAKALAGLGHAVWSALTAFTYFATNYGMVLVARGLGWGSA